MQYLINVVSVLGYIQDLPNFKVNANGPPGPCRVEQSAADIQYSIKHCIVSGPCATRRAESTL